MQDRDNFQNRPEQARERKEVIWHGVLGEGAVKGIIQENTFAAPRVLIGGSWNARGSGQ